MLGGKIEGSNVSERSGYEVLAEITAVPSPGQWTDLSFSPKKAYRWVRYEGPPGSYGDVAEIEFYAGDQKVGFGQFGSLGYKPFHPFQLALDGNTGTYFDSNVPDGQYVGTDVGYWVDDGPNLKPAPGVYPQPVQVSMGSSTPDAVIRYSFKGTPGPDEGNVYSGPIVLDHNATLFAVAYRKGFAVSPTTAGTYIIGAARPGLSSLSVGNSLTGSSFPLPALALTAGWMHDYHRFIMGGAPTSAIWTTYVMNPTKANNDKMTWQDAMASLTRLDDFTAQVHSVKMDEEVNYDTKFFDAVRARFPDVQPWLYSVWTEMFKEPRAVPLGQVPSLQMKTVYPALTWQEADAAWLVYAEDVETKIDASYAGTKKPHVLPCSIAAAWLKYWIDHGKVPGITPELFPFIMFHDNFHSGQIGSYLIAMTWYAAFYHESPVGKLVPIDTELTAEQANALQHLAWDVVENYPDCGLYQEGSEPVATPSFSPAAGALKDVTQVTLTSSTPDAWFRYTLDGTTPARTKGYVYCGVISVRPGMTVKAIAYKSGMADSPVTEAQY